MWFIPYNNIATTFLNKHQRWYVLCINFSKHEKGNRNVSYPILLTNVVENILLVFIKQFKTNEKVIALLVCWTLCILLQKPS